MESRTLVEAVRLMAILGGYGNLRNDPLPGLQIVWRGYDCLPMATVSHLALAPSGMGLG